ncbi:MAG TPA: PEP-CTERM sorting domain-containing protein [Burkholderiales bacterium]
MRSRSAVAALFLTASVLAADAGAAAPVPHSCGNEATTPGRAGNPAGTPAGNPGPCKHWPPGDLTLAQRANGPGTTQRNLVRPKALPEPGTLALLATVLTGIGLGANRKKSV